MGSLSTSEQRKIAYFHSLGKVMTRDSQAVYESPYKSSHNVRSNEIWTDNIIYAIDYTSAVNESISNSAVTLYEETTLSEILGSNGQSWYLDDSGTFIRPWISPVDVPNSITNLPSYGYTLRLFRGDNATNGTPGSEIGMTEGAWSVDYYAGIIHFGVGQTPQDRGWGTIKATIFVYTGNFGSSGGGNNGITSIDFNETTRELIVDEGLPTEKRTSLSALDDKLSVQNINMTANNTTNVSTLATSIPITNIPKGGIKVYINGVQVNVTIDCYFSPESVSNPSIIRNAGEEQQGDYLHWSYTGINPNSGYNLSINDKISFLYVE